jgi:hypothetical protein
MQDNHKMVIVRSLDTPLVEEGHYVDYQYKLFPGYHRQDFGL